MRIVIDACHTAITPELKTCGLISGLQRGMCLLRNSNGSGKAQRHRCAFTIFSRAIRAIGKIYSPRESLNRLLSGGR